MKSTGASRNVSVSRRGSASGSGGEAGAVSDENQNPSNEMPDSSEPKTEDLAGGVSSSSEPINPVTTVPVAALLDYIRSTFDDETVLDSLPLEAAGNPSAWHAWRAHRRGGGNSNSAFARSSRRASPQTRLPGDWHWDGIWAKRAKDEIEASHSEATLFGRGTGDEMVCSSLSFPLFLFCLIYCILLTATGMQIRFSRLDDASLASIKEMMIPRTEGIRE